MLKSFVIMQLGNSQMEDVYHHVIAPALKDCGLEPRRVDKHNAGGLLKSEIIKFIEGADIVIADLTNERPNCYLEVGYAMGAGKNQNLILTVREDHYPDNPKHQPGGPRVHFDLAGYDILFWDPENLDEFKRALVNRISRRLNLIKDAASRANPTWDRSWIDFHRANALAGLREAQQSGFMEVRSTLANYKPVVDQKRLLAAVKGAEVHTFGWPIGVVLQNREELRPRPTTEGIVANVLLPERQSLDYWALRTNGDFYLMQTLFEDERKPGSIFFNTRIVRVTETLMFLTNLYRSFGVAEDTEVVVAVRHGGLKGRILRAAGDRQMFHDRATAENEVENEVHFHIGAFPSNAVELVRELLGPLFMIFDYFELPDEVWKDIVTKFLHGEVT